MEAYIAGLEAYASDPGADLSQGGQRRQLLHQPGRHRDRSPARGDRHTRGARAARQGAPSPRASSPTSSSSETFSRPALGGAGRPGRTRAAAAVGEHVDEEPGLPRHALRRRADRPRHGQHAARRHDRGVRRSRHAGPHASMPTSTRPRRRGRRSPTSASTSTTSPTRSSAKASPASRRASTSCSPPSKPRPTSCRTPRSTVCVTGSGDPRGSR